MRNVQLEFFHAPGERRNNANSYLYFFVVSFFLFLYSISNATQMHISGLRNGFFLAPFVRINRKKIGKRNFWRNGHFIKLKNTKKRNKNIR